MGYRYTKIGQNSFLKESCDSLVTNDLVNSRIIKKSKEEPKEEEPLEMPKMNFSSQADNTSKTNGVKEEEPLEMPKW